MIEVYQDCMPMERDFESLLSENDTSFTLKAGVITVGIYHTDTGIFKIVDSHARDTFGKNSSSGSTCVLLEAIHSNISTVLPRNACN